MKSMVRVRMHSNDAHYSEDLIDRAKILQLFEDVATELLIRNDGDEGLFKGYDNIEFLDPVHSGDYIEAIGEIVAFNDTIRKIVFEAKKDIIVRNDINGSAADYLLNDIVVCKATATCEVPRDRQRK